jgi:hypothetical protein
MKKSQCAIAGFITYGLMEIVGILYGLLSGRLQSSSFEFTWVKFFTMGGALVIMVGLLGSLLGLFFAVIYHRLPFDSIYKKSIFYHLAILMIFTMFKGMKYLLSFDFAFSLVLSVPMALFFGWLCLRLSKERTTSLEART